MTGGQILQVEVSLGVWTCALPQQFLQIFKVSVFNEGIWQWCLKAIREWSSWRNGFLCKWCLAAFQATQVLPILGLEYPSCNENLQGFQTLFIPNLEVYSCKFRLFCLCPSLIPDSLVRTIRAGFTSIKAPFQLSIRKQLSDIPWPDAGYSLNIFKTFYVFLLSSQYTKLSCQEWLKFKHL